MNNHSVSIIIPNYNGALLISRCLDSVFNQKSDCIFEVIVIDDGSTDNSVEIVKKYNNIIVIKQSNQGPAAARNKGIEIATGKYLTFLDADDYWKPTFFKETVSFLNDNPETIAVSVAQIHKTHANKETISPSVLKLNPKKFKEPIVLNDFFAFWAEHNHVCTGSVLLRTEIAKQTGGQRTDLRITEDLEFWAYLATFGKWGFIPKILFASDGGLVTKEQGWLEKNKKRWASAPSIHTWESRILKRLSKNLLPSFNLAKGTILRNLTYAMILSNREKEAYENIIENRELLRSDKLSRLMKFSSYTKFSWNILSILINHKENSRKI